MRFHAPESDYPRSNNRPWLLILPASAIIGIFILMASVSIWNYFDISLPVSLPTSSITESVQQIQEIAKPPAGDIEWSFDTSEAISPPPTAYRSMVIIVAGQRTQTGRIIALDIDSGRPVWTYQLNGVSDYPPTAAGDILYTGTRDGRLIALESSTGREVWSYETEDIPYGSPVVHEGLLYVASSRIHALDALTGDVIWTHVPEGGKAISPLAYSQGIVAVLSDESHLNLIDAGKGKRRLTTRLWFGVAGMPVIVGDIVAVSGDRGSVQAIEIHARDIPMEKALRFWWTKLWIWNSAPRPPDPVGYSWHHRGIGGLTARIAASGDGRLFLVARHPDYAEAVVAMDAASGEVVWSFSSETPLSENLALVGDTLIVGNQAGSVYGLDASSGVVDWQLSLGFPVSAVGVADENSLLITSEDGIVHRIR